MTNQTFLLKEEHIKLLSRAYVQWQNCETGAPEIDPKRPYGNSWVPGNVAEILETDELSEEELMEFHRETETALQIILSTRSFEPGLYKRVSTYSQKWRRV